MGLRQLIRRFWKPGRRGEFIWKDNKFLLIEKDGTLREIKEPSEDFIDIGKSMAEGFAKGMNE